MSSKFFTWTKGDRSKNAPESLYSGGVVPIPVECIHIKGYDYPRTPKHRPVPLGLEPSAEVVSQYDQPKDGQTTLQDTAVKSATSLIAVVNDMLRSPLASARLPPPTPSLAPSFGRPRSRTAPSTPLVEAPSQSLAELPGSIPDRPRAVYHHSYDSKLGLPRRPYSHVKRPSHPWLQTPVDHRSSAPIGEQLDCIPPGNMSTPRESQHQQPRVESTVNIQRLSTTATTPRRNRYIFGQSLEPPRQLHSSTHHNIRNMPSNKDWASFDDSDTSVEDASQLSHASSLQASHQAHLAALTEAHQREVSSLHLYIAHLERRRGLARTCAHPMTVQRMEPDHGSMQDEAYSWCSPSQHHYRTMQTSMLYGRTDTKVDAHCTASAGCGQIWLECNHLRSTLEATNTKLVQSEDAVLRLQNSEAALVTTVENLRSQLSAANSERLDVEETLCGTFSRAHDSTQREILLRQELEQLRKRFPMPKRCGACREGDADGGIFNGHQTSEPTVNTAPRPTSSLLSSSPSCCSNKTPSPSALGITIPYTPTTVASANAQPLLDSSETHAAHMPLLASSAGAHKDIPPSPSSGSKPPAVYSRRSETIKSIGESIIELYSRPDDEKWDRGWGSDDLDDGEVRWLEWL